MNSSEKIIPFEQAPAVLEGLRRANKKIVQCHGTFDLVHPGHIVHFEEAKELGDMLVVTVTSEAHVNKGPGRPYFNDHIRLRSLAALACVDYVVLVPYAAAVEAIECVRPHFYCKGKEYANADNDVTGDIRADVDAVRRVGGEMRYVGSVVFSSSRLINNHFEAHPPEVKSFCREVVQECPPAEFRRLVEEFAELRVLIIGEIIFDRYTTLEVQGLTSKNRILSGRFVQEEIQAGGALAVYRHVREFTPHVKLISLVGTEPWVESTLGQFIAASEEDIVRSPNVTTIVKQRFVEPQTEGKELAKLFSVNFIDRYPPGRELQEALLERIAGHIGQHDLVLVMDFGHGLLEDRIRDYVQDKAKFLALNCQTNSNNHGFNIINRRYRRAEAFTLDQTEISLAVGRRYIDYRTELQTVGRTLGSRYAWLTRGATETVCSFPTGGFCACAPFERSIIDTLGAGDAFCSVASLAAARGLAPQVATFMGQLAGAQAVRIVGNSEPIRKSRFLKGAASMLAF